MDVLHEKRIHDVGCYFHLPHSTPLSFISNLSSGDEGSLGAVVDMTGRSRGASRMVPGDQIWYVLEDRRIFSSIKRIFDESVRATFQEGMMQEAMMKFNYYGMLIAMSK